MGIPGFTADATLYATTVSYRGTLSRHGSFVHEIISGDIPSFALPCDKAGQRCCPPDHQVNTSHCHKSLGCNITTGLCEPCGGPGQVCCDGDYTGFSRKSYSGILLDPTERIQTCNEGARCDALLAPDGVTWTGTRRCTSCGNKKGGSCCAPDASFGLGRCFSDPTIARRLTCNDPWAGSAGTCVVCGGPNEPPCGARPVCDGGLVELNGKCVPCGYAGQPACNLTGCDKYSTIYDWKNDICIAAGLPGQPCRSDGTCIHQGTYCDTNKKCSECGWGWSRGYPMLCCPPGSGPPCMEGTCQRAGKEYRCLCGYENQVPCWNGCLGGHVQRDGVCVKGAAPPPPPPPPSQLKTCNGEAWGFSTMDRPIFIKNPNTKCITTVTYKANSAQEAYTCARRDYGDSVVTESIEWYKFALTSAFGCSGLTLLGTDEDEAQSCAQLQCINCLVTPGDCF